MPFSPSFHFNDLPLSDRQRLADALAGRGPCPVVVGKRISHLQQTGTGLGGVLVGLGILAGLLWTRVAESDPGGPIYDPWRLLGYGAGIALLAGGALAFARELRAHRNRHRCAAPDGTYLLPNRILAIRDGWITSHDLADMTKLDITNHSTNGMHTHTTFEFRFGDDFRGHRVQLRFGQRREAEAALACWEAGRAAFLARVEAGRSVADLDPLTGVDLDAVGLGGLSELSGPRVPDAVPALLLPVQQRGLRLNLALAGAAAACGLLAWGADGLAGDALALRAARRRDTSAAYRLYAERGLLRLGEVRSRLLPAALLREALVSNKAQPLRSFLREFPAFPDAPQARRALDALADQAQARWQAQGGQVEPKAAACLMALLQAMRQPEPEAIRVVFSQPDAKALAAMDQTLGAVETTPATHLLAAIVPEAKPAVEALAPSFTPEACAQREDDLVRQLQEGFARVFLSDLLRLEKGQGGQSPCLHVDYRIDPTARRFSASSTGVQYVGIRFTFDLSIDLPGRPGALRFPLVVEPTDSFKVTYTRMVPAGTPASALKAPTGGEAYGAMASRALDQVGGKVRQVFLGAGAAP